MATIKVFGIPNCDTIKKTMNWFKQQKINIEFCDYKRSGITKEKLEAWCELAGWELLLNKKSTTWKGLTLKVQKEANNQSTAIKLMMENTSIIKRPVIEFGEKLIVGFNEEAYTKTFK